MVFMTYKPVDKLLENYADILVNFALGGGKGIKKGDVVQIVVWESAKPMFIALRKAVLKAGGHPLSKYMPDDEQRLNPSRDFYRYASKDQLKFFPKEYLRGLVDQMDHMVAIISETNKKALAGIDPKKIMLSSQAMKPYMDWRREKENQGKFTWTLALYGTPHMAMAAGVSLKSYWDQIIKACFLNKSEPIKHWQKLYSQIHYYINKLNTLPIKKLHIKGKDIDLWISLGEKRAWKGIDGRNIPSFEIFTSPDWRGTEGWIKFNQPVYRYGDLIDGVELTFAKGRVVKALAKTNQKLLKAIIKTPGADKVGEFSLTDKRFSQIDKFMAETLFDENIGGKYGNTHIALGASYRDCYAGNPIKVGQKTWAKLGYNDSVVHIDMVSTTNRTVTAWLKNGQKKIIYQNGSFII